MKAIILIAILFILTGCEKPKEKNELQVMLSQIFETKVSAGFEILDFSTSTALGDYVETYSFKFKPKDFLNIEIAVKKSGGWKKFQNSEVLQQVKSFEGHGFNGVIATISPESREVNVQFVWE
jgi:outer membrane biogenesis lipoprotein LolB